MKVYFINKKIILMLIFFTFILLSFGIYFSIFKTSNTISDIQNDSNNLYKKLIELYPNEKIAFLTFDDGPNISVTPKVLDILKEENVKATFFVTDGNSNYRYLLAKELKEHMMKVTILLIMGILIIIICYIKALIIF